MRNILLYFLILFHYTLFCQQNNNLVIKGLVVDNYENPILNANISIEGTSRGARTNKKGVFYLTIKENETALKISHIAYYTKNKILQGDIINDTLNIRIQLTQKINELEAFEIRTEKIELLYTKNFVSIYDYQFYENKLLLLIKELKTIKLRLTDINKKILKELILPEYTKSITTDCFGNVHVLSKDSAYQLEIDEQNIRIVFNIPIDRFNTLLKPCVTQFKNTFIFKEKSMSNDIAYYYLDEDNNAHYLTDIKNKMGRTLIAQIDITRNRLKNPSISKVSEFKSSVYTARALMQELTFSNHLLNHSEDSPLFAINKAVYIFDHSKDSCLVFNEYLEFEKYIPINYHHQKKWKKELIVDKEQGSVYAKFEKGGLCYLKKIDLSTGKITDSFKLEKHTFPTKIKVKNNTAYYLYHDRYNHGQMSLYKQSLY